MMHTVLPIEALLPQQQPPQQECRRCRYGWVQGTRLPQGAWQVSRIISTDPKAYLDPKVSPGAFL